MQEKLRRHYQIQKEVSRDSNFQGKIGLGDLNRLADFLLLDRADIEVEFKFSQSDYDLPMVEGEIQTRLTIECQRCLKAMEIPLKINFQLLVSPPGSEVIESSLDTVFSENGSVDIFAVVEDELILGLPLVTMHEDIACNEYWQTQAEDPELATKENPFSVLAKLKTTH
jgi:uncharacterized protein